MEADWLGGSGKPMSPSAQYGGAGEKKRSLYQYDIKEQADSVSLYQTEKQLNRKLGETEQQPDIAAPGPVQGTKQQGPSEPIIEQGPKENVIDLILPTEMRRLELIRNEWVFGLVWLERRILLILLPFSSTNLRILFHFTMRPSSSSSSSSPSSQIHAANKKLRHQQQQQHHQGPRGPFRVLNGISFSPACNTASVGSDASSTSTDAPRGCLRFFLSHSSSSSKTQTPANKLKSSSKNPKSTSHMAVPEEALFIRCPTNLKSWHLMVRSLERHGAKPPYAYTSPVLLMVLDMSFLDL
ncbi:hypothetical protein SDJN02_22279, partial [Cucurbita argyrosperma subsp. argyrosperma]